MNAMPVAKADDLLGKPRTPREDGFVTLDACHRKTLNAVEALEDLTGAIARGEDTPSLRASATAVADFLSTTARLHHEDEERHVFPALRGSANAAIVQAVMSLTQDHGWLEEDWLQLEPHLRAYACGYGLCEVEALTLGVPVFAALYREHIALEESLIYPEAREQMAGAARREMGREMAARRRVRRPDARP